MAKPRGEVAHEEAPFATLNPLANGNSFATFCRVFLINPSVVAARFAPMVFEVGEAKIILA